MTSKTLVELQLTKPLPNGIRNITNGVSTANRITLERLILNGKVLRWLFDQMAASILYRDWISAVASD